MKIKEWLKLKKDDKIIFNKKTYTLIEDMKNADDVPTNKKMPYNTPLCTEEQYDNFEVGDAHIYWNKKGDSAIMSYRKKIGTIEDIKRRLSEPNTKSK